MKAGNCSALPEIYKNTKIDKSTLKDVDTWQLFCKSSTNSGICINYWYAALGACSGQCVGMEGETCFILV